tara:strand:+ start:50 stop:532 length:483 start_codon:yes stop_codon:yes gene_type:complete
MSTKIETPKRVETIKEEIEKALTTNPMYKIDGKKWYEQTHTQHFWNTDHNHGWLTEKGFRTAHYRRTLLEQEKRKVQDLQSWADNQARKLAESVLEELVYESIDGYDYVVFFEEKHGDKTLKEWNAENRLALAKKVLEAQTQARFRRRDYQILKRLKVTG